MNLLGVLLTKFHGSEMTLRDGVNGRLLSYDPEVMLGKFLACVALKPRAENVRYGSNGHRVG